MTAGVGALAVLADRYRLEERIAVGGMGEVWRATDTVLDRTVAVKTLRPEYVQDADFRARFRAEARHSARLSHPGIASVFDFGESADDGAFLVMELVDGEPLSTVLRREGSLPADRVLDVVAQTAAALQAAHDGGVVHRDVKPGNLLVRPDGVVKVTDFGIASATDAVPLTRTGQVVGTAFYLAPEQASGTGAGPASDLYSLGVVAYEALAGARPFPGEHPVAVLLSHLNDVPPPLPPSVPAPVAELVLSLLAKDPADRPGPASAVAARATRLREGVADQPLLPVAPPVAARTTPETRSLTTARPPLRRPSAGPLSSAAPVPVVGAPPPPGSDRTGQRRAVRGIAVVLGLLALAAGLRSTLAEASTTVPALPAGATEAQAVSALDRADLDATTSRAPSSTVPAGTVVSMTPAAGTELDEGSAVQLVVSSGRPPVLVEAAELVGKPAEAARAGLAAAGLVPSLAYDGKGAPVGTVAAVEPVGPLPAGSTVVLRIVPEPPEPVVVPAPPAPARDGDRGKDEKKDEKDDD